MYVIVNIEEASGPVVQIMGPKQTKNVWREFSVLEK